MKKIFTFFAAALAAMTLSAAELTLDLNAAQGYASADGSASVEVISEDLQVHWNVATGWEVAGAEFALNNVSGISEISFDYKSDGADVDMLVYLVDAEGNNLWDSEVGGQSLASTNWQSVTLHPSAGLWTSPSEGPWVKLRFVANPATPLESQFYLRNIKIKDDSPEPVLYNVAEAIAKVDSNKISDGNEIKVLGVVSKIEFKGKNFAKYGSANIYVADATGAEGEFEFYNCYSLLADTFRTSDPAFDATGTSWAQLQSVTDGNEVTVHVGDTVIAQGKFKKFNTTYELDQACYLIDIKPYVEPAPAALFEISYENKWLNIAPADTATQYFVFLEDKEFYDNRYQLYDQATMGDYLDFMAGQYVALGMATSFIMSGNQKLNPNALYSIDTPAGMNVNHDYVAFVFHYVDNARTSDIEYLAFKYLGEPVQDAVENVMVDAKAQKVMVDGVIYIVRDNKMYNLQGTELK